MNKIIKTICLIVITFSILLISIGYIYIANENYKIELDRHKILIEKYRYDKCREMEGSAYDCYGAIEADIPLNIPEYKERHKEIDKKFDW